MDAVAAKLGIADEKPDTFDEALAKIGDADAEPDGTEGTEEAGASGEDKAGEKAPEGAKAGKGDAAGKRQPTRDQREQVVLATRALARDGWSDDEIAKIQTTVGLDAFLEKGRKAAARQKAVDRMNRDLLKTKAGGRTPQREDGSEPADNPPERFGEGDSQAGQEAAAQPMAGDIGELVEKGLVDPSVAEAIQASHRTEAEKLSRAQALAVQSRFVSVVNRLVDRFPGLSQKESLDKVWNWCAKYDPDGEYALGDDAAFQRHVEDACKVEFGDQLQRQTRESLIRTNAKAVANAPRRPGGPSNAPRIVKQDQYEDLALRAASETTSMAELEQRMASVRRT